MRFDSARWARPSRIVPLLIVTVASASVAAVRAQTVSAPRAALGFAIGEDHHLATYTQLMRYWEQLAAESPRMVLDTIGRTAEGRPQLMAILTSPENHRRLDEYRTVARRLALADGVSEAEARALAARGKAIVWIDGGLHATEVLGAHQLMELVYQMTSMNDAETTRILDDVIILAVHANPDGMELVSEWYMREPEPTKRSTSNIPRLYQKYIGHDNNRDFYMVTQPETENMARAQYIEWFPQIVYNHHQTGPEGAVLFAPPFRDPFNYNFDPLVPLGIDAVGAAMHSRFVAEGKGGATMRSGASYSTWWNGGLRTTAYFHNMIGLLTETIGNPTPMEIPFVLERQLPSGNLPLPIEPQRWQFRQSIDYSISANRAVLDYASRYRETLLFNIYRMGRNAIERGSRDHWTIHPAAIEAVRARGGSAVNQPASSWRPRALPTERFAELRRPEDRDPRGFILSADQPDFPTAVKFVNALVKTGVAVHRATAPFEVGGTRYPEGSLVVRSDQAFRAHVLDMFEPQDHPNDFAYPGGPPLPPYDNAGWTLAFQMGIEFDRILEGFEGPFARIEGFASVPAETIVGSGTAGYVLSHRQNDAVVIANRVLRAGGRVFWLMEPTTIDGTRVDRGAIFVPSDGVSRAQMAAWVGALGVTARAVARLPSVGALAIRPARVALWDRYGGSMTSGWTRWLLEQFEFPFEVVYPRSLNESDLSRFDVIVLPDGALSSREGGRSSGRVAAESIPAEFRERLGALTKDETVPRLRAFVERGGSLLAIGSSADPSLWTGLPVADHLVDESGNALRGEQYYVPGSVLRVTVDTTQPIAFGLTRELDVLFDNSPVFRETSDAPGVEAIARFTTDRPLRSGWAWGQEHLEGGIAALRARLGRGTLYLFGPEVLYRGQPHGSFKLFFNGIHLARADTTRLGGQPVGGQ
jgi:hypothetical protein